MQRYTKTGGEIWDMEKSQSPRMGSVILGVDGGAGNTVCVCIPAAMPFADPLPVLSRAVAGCSNHNSVGGIISSACQDSCTSFDSSCVACAVHMGFQHRH